MHPEHVKKLRRESFQKKTQNDPEHVKKLRRASFNKSKKNNPEHIKRINKKSQKKRRDKKASSVTNDSPSSSSNYVSKNNNSTSLIDMPKVIQSFHDNIEVGPEYVCTCCGQLWYKSIRFRHENPLLCPDESKALLDIRSLSHECRLD